MNKFNQSNLLLTRVRNNYFIPINNQLLTKNLININLTKFLNEIMKKIDNKHVMLLFRVQHIDDTYRTIGNLQKVNQSDFSKIFSLLINLFSI
jgi:hypothetical protein